LLRDEIRLAVATQRDPQVKRGASS
jgi:hypothetical protein